MKRRDLYSSVFFIALGTCVSFRAWKLGVGHGGEPGPGFLPFLSGVLLLGLSVCLLFGSIARGSGKNESLQFYQIGRKGRRIVMTISLLVLYLPLIYMLGFIISTTIFVLVTMWLIARERLSLSLVTAIIVSGVSYLLFRVLLEVDLPEGFLGF